MLQPTYDSGDVQSSNNLKFRMTKNRVVGIGIAILLIAIVLGIWVSGNVGDNEERGAPGEYVSEEFGFSFTYPAHAALTVYTPASIALDANSLGGFNAADAEVVVLTSGEDTYESYDAFVTDRLQSMCAADGPGGTVYCDDIRGEVAFTTNEGTAGTEAYLMRTEEDLATGKQDTERFGPVFAFDMSGNLGEVPYATLVVRPPLTDSAEQVNDTFVREIAQSIAVFENAPAEAAMLGLVTAISADGAVTITFERAEWFEGDAAVEAAVADTDCTAANIETCAPSIANNFYVRTTATAETIPVADDARIVLLDNTAPEERTIDDLNSRIATGAEMLAAIEVVDGAAVRIEEIYLP